ncbi:glutathione S-transferas-like protein [Coleophoma cylindrospora]|uniref:Glutathione S-transferas-like protein n=1 Tax=Coleophoma cylindrospora TaxID=1849047 RepID=A0A3D8STM6_9HELO|nr:glutathione S-transferas-like protein [Coleophoma cylindrospora]
MASEAPSTTFKDGAWHGMIEPNGPFPPEKGRYHMYIGLFCPFAHRANLIRHLKGLTEIISISVVKPYPKGDEKGWPGWKFPTSDDEYAGATVDDLFHSEYLHDVYFRDKKDYAGRYTVPLVWDTKTNQIVNNESLEILRNWNTGFDTIIPEEFRERDFYPENLRAQIDEIGKWMQDEVNTGVYKAGFASDQETYEKNVVPVFNALNKLEKILSQGKGPYLLGDVLTELDIRLYPTIIRFDTVYVQHFKCNLGTIRNDYPLLNNWLKNLYWNVKGFKESTDFRHIKENYTKSHPLINPLAITPLGPTPDVETGYEADWSKLRKGGVYDQALGLVAP